MDLDGPAVALVPQEDQMYMSAGKDQWYLTQFNLSSDNTKEQLVVNRLKTTANQATQSQYLTTNIRDNVVFVSNEPIVSTLGRVANVVLTPQISDISSPIINDMTSYDFTGGHASYWQNYLLVSVPTQGIVRIFNMTNPSNMYWEAPQLLPFSCFSIIDGDLYGHSSGKLASYKMFDGYNDAGFPIQAIAKFAFDSQGMRPTKKNFNEFYVEGYISSNTVLTLGIQYDLDSKGTATSFSILGNDSRIVSTLVTTSSLGKSSLGKNPLGADIATVDANSLPAKFRVIKTFPRLSYYEYQPSFTSEGVDQQWEIIGFGPAWGPASESNVDITE